MVPEADLEQTEGELVPVSTGWFVMNARGARWFDKPGQGHSLPLTGHDEYEAETFFPMLGMAIQVVDPGEPTGTYHWETEQEDFLVLSGEALLIVEGQEHRLKQWDSAPRRIDYRNFTPQRRSPEATSLRNVRGSASLRCAGRDRDGRC